MKKVTICFIAFLMSVVSIVSVKADELDKDYSTAYPANEIITSDLLISNGATPEISQKLKDKSGELIEKYVSNRLITLKERYKGYEQLNAFDKNIIDQQESAEKLDRYIADNFSKASQSRKEYIGSLIDKAGNADAINAIAVSANLYAWKTNISVAEDLIKDLPDSDAKKTIENNISILKASVDKWDQPLRDLGFPANPEDIPSEYEPTPELSRMISSANEGNTDEVRAINNQLVASAANLQRTQFVSAYTYEFKNKIIEKSFKDYLNTELPFYLGDTLRGIMPELDAYAEELTNSETVNPKTPAETVNPKTPETSAETPTETSNLKSSEAPAEITESKLPKTGENNTNPVYGIVILLAGLSAFAFKKIYIKLRKYR